MSTDNPDTALEPSPELAADLAHAMEELWPAHFPKNCPPPDAVPTDGKVYRRLDGTPNDWKSYLERNLAPRKDSCQRASLSCYQSLEALREAMTVHEGWPQKKIVVAHLRPEHGRIKQTGTPRHYSLWLYRRSHEVCAQLFEVIP